MSVVHVNECMLRAGKESMHAQQVRVRDAAGGPNVRRQSLVVSASGRTWREFLGDVGQLHWSESLLNNLPSKAMCVQALVCILRTCEVRISEIDHHAPLFVDVLSSLRFLARPPDSDSFDLEDWISGNYRMVSVLIA